MNLPKHVLTPPVYWLVWNTRNQELMAGGTRAIGDWFVGPVSNFTVLRFTGYYKQQLMN